MEKRYVSIQGIPAVLWGSEADKLIIAVHGDQSNKEDCVIAVLGEEVTQRGYQVLSLDLPEHGERREAPRRCSPQNSIEDLEKAILYAKGLASQVSMFGCSLGAYFGMMAYQREPIKQALLLSPVVCLQHVIENIMRMFNISKEKLQSEKKIITPMKTLYWEDYEYIIKHPVRWNAPTALLYGEADDICAFEDVSGFAERTQATLTVMSKGEHYFHTEEQIAFFRQWLNTCLY